MIYRALLRLYPTSIREQFAEEMLAVHSSACERARVSQPRFVSSFSSSGDWRNSIRPCRSVPALCF